MERQGLKQLGLKLLVLQPLDQSLPPNQQPLIAIALLIALSFLLLPEHVQTPILLTYPFLVAVRMWDNSDVGVLICSMQ